MDILFCSHQSKTYGIDSWRHVFSQWYCSGDQFIGNIGIYDLSEFISQDDWDSFVLNKHFDLREQWMMCLKALVFAKNEYRNMNLKVASQIMATKIPAKVKEYGRKVSGYDDTVWDKCKYQIVANGNYLEFSQNTKMKDILMATKNRLIFEAASYDKVWGIGFNETDALTVSKDKWGKNLLGKAIMEVREKLIELNGNNK